jgi:hypothetical protein
MTIQAIPASANQGNIWKSIGAVLAGFICGGCCVSRHGSSVSRTQGLSTLG